MKKLMTPDMILGLVIILVCMTLLLCHINGEVKTILGMAAMWVFGRASGVIHPRIYRSKK